MDGTLEQHVPKATRGAMPELQKTVPFRVANNLKHYIAVFSVSLAILTAGVASDHTQRLDELLYINAARAFIAGTPSTNIEHPPFAKCLIAISIKAFGDTPLGWRFSSGLAGALIALSGFGLTLRLTRSRRSATIAWLLLLANGFLFVESRSANLIIFQTAFEVAGVWAFAVALEKEEEKKEENAPGWFAGFAWFAWSAALLGLSVASRWCGVTTLVVCGLYSLLRARRVTKGLLLMAASSLAAYVVSWIPLLLREHRSLAYLISANRYILVSHALYRQNMVDVRASDPWWAWMFRFDQPVALMQLMANPFVASLGLLALLALLWQRKPLLPALYALHMVQWALAHSLPQYYYYYLDAFTWLTIGLAVALQNVSCKRVRLDVIVTACAFGSALWPLCAALRY